MDTQEPTPFPTAPLETTTSGAASGERGLTRAQVREIRRRAREQGATFACEATGITARVRLLNLFQKSSLQGLPLAMQQRVLRVFNPAQGGGQTRYASFGDLLKAAADDEELTNGACIMGFVSPRLVATEAEADAADSDDVWYVGDIDLADRRKYSRRTFNADSEKEARDAARDFLRREVVGS